MAIYAADARPAFITTLFIDWMDSGRGGAGGGEAPAQVFQRCMQRFFPTLNNHVGTITSKRRPMQLTNLKPSLLCQNINGTLGQSLVDLQIIYDTHHHHRHHHRRRRLRRRLAIVVGCNCVRHFSLVIVILGGASYVNIWGGFA